MTIHQGPVHDLRAAGSDHTITATPGEGRAAKAETAEFGHGDAVILSDGSGTEVAGTLYLPPTTMYGPRGRVRVAAPTTDGSAYQVRTVLRADGRRFRTEGRLRAA